MPALEDVSDSDDEEDSPTEEEAAPETLLTSQKLVAAAVITDPQYEVEIYDPGATPHMTPSRHRLTNYRAIEPRAIMAADNKRFDALGKGDMYVQVPNGKDRSTKVLVKDVCMHLNSVSLLSLSRASHRPDFPWLMWPLHCGQETLGGFELSIGRQFV